MLFNSLQFLIFFPIVLALYFLIKPKYRWIMLLMASYYFYMCWNYKYILLILFSTIVDYFAGIYIAATDNRKKKKLFLFASLLTNLGLLFSFKYFNFFGESINLIFDKLNFFYNVPAFKVLLPVGISFYTFQTLSYTIDIYREKKEPEKHFGIFALYVSFFPQLVAGPIERSSRLLPQFRKEHSFDYNRIRDGIVLMIWGYFKKVVIADRLAEYVNLVFNHATDFKGLQNVVATFFFSFQIYCDFSGYSDIAIGAALIMGYRLMTNFNRPYLSRSIREFWRRWHISLSTWFRDYLYIPLGGNRVVKWRWYYNLIVTFVISGLWHGANWTFIIWGALHGFYHIFAIWTGKIRNKVNGFFRLDRMKIIHAILEIFITFILAIFAWIFFRANNFSDALLLIKNLFTTDFFHVKLNLFTFKADFYLSFILIGFLMAYEIFEERYEITNIIYRSRRFIKWALYLLLLSSIFILGKWEEADFLYFQF